MKRQFLLETKGGREIGTVEAEHQRAAIDVARGMFKEPANGWGSVRVFAQLLPSAIEQLDRARVEVNASLEAFPTLKCPEGCARMAGESKAAGMHALAAEWYAAAEGCTIGHSRSAMYAECRLQCIRNLDAGYEPWNNIF